MPRIGLSGCGAIGALHSGNLAKRGVDLAFHNRTRSKADDFARRFGGEACAELDTLIEGCDALVIATPPEQHTEAVVAALTAGKPVMVEKPLCVSADQLARIETIAAAAPAGAFVMVAENYYYKPSLVLMREVVAWDGIGAVQSMMVKKLTQQTAAGWKAAHGALLEGGIHFVALVADLADAALLLAGSNLEKRAAAALAGEVSPTPVRSPDEVEARFPTSSTATPERRSSLCLRYANGPEVMLHYAWDAPTLLKGTMQHSRVDGEAGRIVFESNGIYVHVRGPGRKGLSLPGFGDLMGYGAMTDDFLSCVTAGAAPYSDLTRARRDLGIVFRAYEQLP